MRARGGSPPVRRLLVHDPRRAIGPDDLFPREGDQAAPRLVRFLTCEGAPRIGLVLTSSQGLPRRILDLTARRGLGPGLLEFARAGGFEVAEDVLAGHEGDEEGSDVVVLETEDLPGRLLSPVDIDGAQITSGERLVVGFGLTFRRHRDETRRARPIVFPKPTAPTGAYAPVVAGADDDGPVTLLDYELELGCVALQDIDLGRLDRMDPDTDFAYTVVNAVTARGPILRSRRSGYAHAKGRPTYLPCGPWVVAGRHFARDAPALRRMVLTVDEATVDEAAAPDGGGERRGRHTLRQNARLEELTLGLQELLELVARRRTVTMPGPAGRRWPISVERDGRRIIPAGSLLLTGTPGGTAIRSPSFAEQLSLVLRSLRYLRWPSEDYRRHLEDHRHAFGFLSPGDRVSGWITGLGRQEWQVGGAAVSGGR